MASENQMRQELGQFLVAGKWHGTSIALPQKQEAAIKEMAGTIPTAEKAKYKTELAQAYRVMQIMQQSEAGGNPGSGTPNAGGTDPGANIPMSARKEISDTFLANQAETLQVTANTMITAILLDKPAPKDLIDDGAKGKVKDAAFKKLLKQIEDGDLQVCPDDGADVAAEKRIMSTTNWNTIKKAYEDGTELDVYRGNLTGRPIGYKVIKGSAQGQGVEEILDRNEMFEFVTLETEGYIQPSPKTPGVKLKQVSKTSKTPGAPATQTTVLADLNRKQVLETEGTKEQAFIVTCVKEKTKSPATLKSELRVKFFKPNDEKKEDGTMKTVTKRISLEGERYDVARAGEYKEKFGSLDNYSKNNLLEPPTGKQATQIAEARIAAVYEMKRKAASGVSGLSVEARDRLKKFEGGNGDNGADNAPAADI